MAGDADDDELLRFAQWQLDVDRGRRIMSAIRDQLRKQNGQDPTVADVLVHVCHLPDKPRRQVNAFVALVRARRRRAERGAA